jgi:hypothetical protein
VRLFGLGNLSVLFGLAAAAMYPSSALAQQTTRDTTQSRQAADSSAADSAAVDSAALTRSVADTVSPFSLEMHFRRDSLRLATPASFGDFGRFSDRREATEAVADRRTAALLAMAELQRAAMWGATIQSAFAPEVAPVLPDSGPVRDLAGLPPPADSLRPPGAATQPDSLSAVLSAQAPPSDSLPDALKEAGGLLGQYADLGLQLQARLESKLERNKNDRCTSFDLLSPVSNCNGSFQPQFDFQFNVQTGGTVADRVHVNVDYDSEREFDASNNVNVYYQGKSDEILERLEIGNVSFDLPPSRFITGGIPAGNYGLQATGQLGPMNFRSIFAQQKGNVVKDRVFTVGDQTVQTINRDIEDYQVETRRFFWVVDPAVEFPAQFPNIDILDNSAMASLAAQLPAGRRPRRVLVYRYRPPTAGGSVAQDINGPTAVALGARNQNPIGPYEVLQQGVDYYIDPTNLWVVLVSPVSQNERIAVSYTVTGAGGAEATIATVGGTFPTGGASRIDTLQLLWDNAVLPGDPPFSREMRNVYRLGGEDITRPSVSLKIVVGSGEQERSATPGAPTFLQLFGLSQPSNGSTFDAQNRLWPRPGDPNQAANAGGGSTKLIKDNFIVFPSLQPFANAGLANPPDPVNDSLYRTPDDDLVSQRRPPTQYKIRAEYQAEGGGDAGVISLSPQIRQGSERVMIRGVQLQRDLDYRMDYELGQVTFLRPDTLFRSPQQVSVKYEENPLFASAPTSIFGFASEFPMEHGQLSFVAISQSQKSSFNRPPLGLEPASSFVAGLNGNFSWESASLTRALDGLPMVETSAPSSVSVQGEFATSRPQPNAAGQAYVESFEAEGGTPLSLAFQAWRTGSQPAVPGGFATIAGQPFDFDTTSASTLAWQNIGIKPDASGRPVQVTFFADDIDTTLVFTGNQALRLPETVLWLTLYPLSVGGQFCDICVPQEFQWNLPGLAGRRWRSINQSLSPTGTDLSKVEDLEFWALIDTSSIGRQNNPALMFDFGDISENSIAFVPETLLVRNVTDTAFAPDGTITGLRDRVDSTWFGKRLEGFGRMDTERDPLTKSFDFSLNDIGIPGDRADSLVVIDGATNTAITQHDVALCQAERAQGHLIGDTRDNCTVRNRLLDEEDLDVDGVLNLAPTARDQERLFRYLIDLSDASLYNRFGKCFNDAGGAASAGGTLCWVNFKIPFSAPTQTINNPLIRRVKAMRMTVVSAPNAPESNSQLAIARLKLSGSPWIKRSDQSIDGVAGANPSGSGFVIASVVGTQDRDSRLGGLFYQSPPGVVDEAENVDAQVQQSVIQINERSMRLVTAGDLPVLSRAEAFIRFPQGEKSFMGYRELRVWARGRNKGWGPGGDLQFYVKIGRDQDNFYLRRVEANSGLTQDAWLPEVVVDFDKLISLRARLQNNFLRDGTQIDCTGLDSALVVNSELPTAPGSERFAACDDGYIVYTANPGLSPPNLAAVQELAVGILRVGDAGVQGGTILPSDSLEVWVDDIRLTGVVDDAGYAGQFALSVQAGDVGTIQLSASRRDKNFRQLGELPGYTTANDIGVSTSFRLDKFLPSQLGLIVPVSINYASTGTDPFFLDRTDVIAEGVVGLRKNASKATTYSISARRATPLRGGILAPLLNNLNWNATYGTSNGTSEYSTGNTRRFSSGLDWSLSSTAKTFSMPDWFDSVLGILPGFLENSAAIKALKNSNIRWNPAQLRFNSQFAKVSNSRRNFTLPVEVAGDQGSLANSLSSVWSNTGTLELRPLPSVTARWNITSLRDLRDYGDTVPPGGQVNVGAVARGERDRLFGADIGLERQRTMSMILGVNPGFSTWFKPHFDFTTSYSMLRDPNGGRVLRTQDSTGEFRLPRRLQNTQGLGLGASVDLTRALSLHSKETSFARRLSGLFQPIDVNWRRDLRSGFDGVPFTPGLGYQFGLGGLDDFRSLDGEIATSAGVTHSLNASSGINLPLNTQLQFRYSTTASTAFARRLDAQSAIETEQTTFPDVSLRWSLPPRTLSWLLQSVGVVAEARTTDASTFQPTVGEGGGEVNSEGAGIRTSQHSTVYRLSPSITWAIGSGLTTSGGWSKTQRTELRSGGTTLGTSTELSGNVGKSFKLPARFEGRMLRWTAGFAKSHSQTLVMAQSSIKRTQDLGRWAINMNADTDISEQMQFSMTLSRATNFDNLFDRHFTQFVLTAALHLTFFAGELR